MPAFTARDSLLGFEFPDVPIIPTLVPPSHPSQLIPISSQPGPVRARFSRGWAEIGVDFSIFRSIGVGLGFLCVPSRPLWLKILGFLANG